jgi:hypothetical protein
MPEVVFDLASQTPWMRLLDHIFYGLVTGLVFGWMAFRSVTARTTAAGTPAA